ncbi:MAG: hypothetical protein QGG09_21830, partial [Pirellulaceae bacterium]|nr:hypothetical protein [Pirellulaceae bacterium]
MSTIVTFSGRLQSKPVWIFAALTIVALPPTAAGQQRQPFPFSDPQRMFEQFFGAVPAEDREKIDKIT